MAVRLSCKVVSRDSGQTEAGAFLAGVPAELAAGNTWHEPPLRDAIGGKSGQMAESALFKSCSASSRTPGNHLTHALENQPNPKLRKKTMA